MADILSTRQHTLLKKLPTTLTREEAQRYNQSTFGSLLRRGYYIWEHGLFVRTEIAEQVMYDFYHADIMRRSIDSPLTVYFERLYPRRNVVVLKKRSAA